MAAATMKMSEREANTKPNRGGDEREKERRGGERALPAEETGIEWWLGRRQETMVAAVRTETDEEEKDKNFERRNRGERGLTGDDGESKAARPERRSNREQVVVVRYWWWLSKERSNI